MCVRFDGEVGASERAGRLSGDNLSDYDCGCGRF